MRRIFGAVDAGCWKEGSEKDEEEEDEKGEERGENGEYKDGFYRFRSLLPRRRRRPQNCIERSDSLGDDTSPSRITWRTHTQLDQKDNADGSLPLSILTKSSGILDGVGVKLFFKKKTTFSLGSLL